MNNYGKVYSSTQPQEIEITNNAVFLASNVKPYTKNIDDHIQEGYEYDYVEYTKDEYLLKLTNDNKELQQSILDTQLALVELYEGGEL